MYYHVYADLVVLAKSKELHKSVFDMRQHYLELKLFLEELLQHPQVVFDSQLQVFISEPRLYAENSKLNHRCHESQCVHNSLFHNLPTQSDRNSLCFKISTGAKLMREKLCTYAFDFLPGGAYWNPHPETSKVLRSIEPSNDLCESILGLNGYLTSSLPNLQQITRSNLVEIKKNGTMQWLSGLPTERQSFISPAKPITCQERVRKRTGRNYQEKTGKHVVRKKKNVN